MALLCRICCYLGLHGKAGYAAECGGAILRLLLELLDRALHQRPLAGDFKVEVEAEGVRLIVATADASARLTTDTGTLTLGGVAVEVHRP